MKLKWFAPYPAPILPAEEFAQRHAISYLFTIVHAAWIYQSSIKEKL